jgi:hypothetical protein
MKTISILALAVLLAAMPARADRRRAAAPAPEALAIEFVADDAASIAAGSDAWLDVQTISGVTHIRRRIGIRVVRTGAIATGTVVLTARIDASDGRASIRLDGRPITLVPLVVDAHAVAGRITFHTLDIEVRADAADGPLAATITWEATTE